MFARTRPSVTCTRTFHVLFVTGLITNIYQTTPEIIFYFLPLKIHRLHLCLRENNDSKTINLMTLSILISHETTDESRVNFVVTHYSYILYILGWVLYISCSMSPTNLPQESLCLHLASLLVSAVFLLYSSLSFVSLNSAIFIWFFSLFLLTVLFCHPFFF